MDPQQAIEKLKLLTVKRDQDLAIPAHHFLDHIAENPQVDACSRLLKSSEVTFYQSLLKPVLAERYGESVHALRFLLLRVKKSHFIHGVVLLSNGAAVGCYFFEDSQLGMALLPLSVGQMHFCRLTVWEADQQSGAGNSQPVSILSTTQH